MRGIATCRPGMALTVETRRPVKTAPWWPLPSHTNRARRDHTTISSTACAQLEDSIRAHRVAECRSRFPVGRHGPTAVVGLMIAAARTFEAFSLIFGETPAIHDRPGARLAPNAVGTECI